MELIPYFIILLLLGIIIGVILVISNTGQPRYAATPGTYTAASHRRSGDLFSWFVLVVLLIGGILLFPSLEQAFQDKKSIPFQGTKVENVSTSKASTRPGMGPFNSQSSPEPTYIILFQNEDYRAAVRLGKNLAISYTMPVQIYCDKKQRQFYGLLGPLEDLTTAQNFAQAQSLDASYLSQSNQEQYLKLCAL